MSVQLPALIFREWPGPVDDFRVFSSVWLRPLSEMVADGSMTLVVLLPIEQCEQITDCSSTFLRDGLRGGVSRYIPCASMAFDAGRISMEIGARSDNNRGAHAPHRDFVPGQNSRPDRGAPSFVTYSGLRRPPSCSASQAIMKYSTN